jgi:hypothetical protein
VASLAGPETGCHLVDAALDSDQPSLPNLVSHRISQRLDRRPRPDRIAVEVQEVVELLEPQAPVTAENRKARGAEMSTPQGLALIVQGRQRRFVVAPRSSPVTPVDPWPEAITKLGEASEQRTTNTTEFLERVVDVSELRQQVVPLDLEANADAAVQAGGVPDHELTVWTDWMRGLGHDCAPSGCGVVRTASRSRGCRPLCREGVTASGPVSRLGTESTSNRRQGAPRSSVEGCDWG